MNLATKSFAISSPMALRFPSSKRCRCYFTSLEPSLIFKVCSTTSLGMPGMSEGFHAKMSLLARRKPTCALSYLEKSMVPYAPLCPWGYWVYEDLLGALHWLKRPGRPFGVRCFFGDLLPDGCELFGGDDCRSMIATLDGRSPSGRSDRRLWRTPTIGGR